MKTKTTLLTLLVAFVMLQSFQQKKGYDEIHYQALDPIKTDEYTISFSDMHSQSTFCLIRAEVINHTDDFLFFDLSKIKFTVNGNTVAGEQKEILIKPNAIKKINIKSLAAPGMPSDKVDVEIAGVRRLPVDGDVSKLENYPLPDSKKEISNSDLKVALSSLKKETRVTDAKWKVTNTGSTPILYDPSAISVTCKGNDGSWPTETMNKDYKILWPGKKLNVKASFKIPGRVVDMQFANMSVHWNKAFLRSEMTGASGCKFSMEIDLGKTEGMN